MVQHTPRALRALLHGIVDYAGLFPPAGLGMAEAVQRYAAHRTDADGWMLGRFVVAAARLDDFAAAAGAYLPRDGKPWRLSALVGPETEADLARVAQFNDTYANAAVIDTLEARAATVGGIERLAAALPRGLTVYVELSSATKDPAPLVRAVGAARLRAKLRTGGVTADAFPRAGDVVRFLATCASVGVPFKATAGLHHPVRGERALTYAADAPRGVMHGFLNVFLAAALLRDGLPQADALRLIEETDAAAFTADDSAVRWRDHAVTAKQLAAARERFAIAFGSCSFREPVDDLRSLGLL